MSPRWVISGAVGALAIAGGAYLLRGRPVPAMASAVKTNVQIVEAKRGDISEVVEAGGRVYGNRDVVVNCVASGEVVKLPVAAGDWVKKGDLICQLDSAQEQKAVSDAKTTLSRAVHKLEQTQQSARLAEADLEVSVQQAEESINSLRVKATNSRNKADRQKTLLAQSLSSQEEYETAETQASEADTEFRNAVLAKEDLKDRCDMLKNEQSMRIEAVEDEVRSDEVSVKNATDRLNSTTIASPIDGIVSDVKTSLETWIEQSGGEYARQPVAVVSDLSRLFVTVSVGERKIGLVHVGDKAQIRADSYPGKSFPGTVTWVAPTGVSNDDSVTFWVKIEVEGPDKALLKPPMTAVARITQASRSNVLLLPDRAVERGEKGAHVRLVGQDGRQMDRAVQIGASDGANDEILDGLAAGDRVVVRSAGGVEVAANAGD